MIELTDEMRAAVRLRMGVPDGAYLDPWMEAAIGDVLAIVERDWNMQPNPAAARPCACHHGQAIHSTRGCDYRRNGWTCSCSGWRQP